MLVRNAGTTSHPCWSPSCKAVQSWTQRDGHGVRAPSTAYHLPQARFNIKTVFIGGGFQLRITYSRANDCKKNVTMLRKRLDVRERDQNRIITQVWINFEQFPNQGRFWNHTDCHCPWEIYTKFRILVCVVLLKNVHHYGGSRWVHFVMIVTHWGRDKIAAIFQTTFSNAFSWKTHEFRLRFHWNL